MEEGLEVIQSMIDISADRLERLRTQCATSAELTQQETRSLESKLVRMFCELLLTRQNMPAGTGPPTSNEDLRQWLRVVGLSKQTINAVMLHVNTLEELLAMSEDEICAVLSAKNQSTLHLEESHHLICAINALKRCQQCVKNGTEPSDMYWDSWDRRHNIRSSSRIANGRLTTVIVSDQSIHDELIQSPTELSPPDTQNSSSSLMTSGTLTSSSDKLLNMISPEEGSGVSNLSPSPSPPQSPSVYNTTSQSSSGSNNKRLVAKALNNNLNNNHPKLNGTKPDSSLGTTVTSSNHLNNNNDVTIEMSIDSYADGMIKSKSNESQLSVNGPHKNLQNGSTQNVSEAAGENVTPIIISDTSAPPRSPCTPVRVMAHIIQHRFSKKFKFRTSTCDLCLKQMFFGFKCTECKYRCHKDCKSNVPPSCGLPKELVNEFAKTLQSESLMPNASPNLSARVGLMPSKRSEPRYRSAIHSVPFHGADSSSAGSSCNSSSPSSPALLTIPPQTPANKSQFNFPEVSSAAVTNQNHQNSHHNNFLPNTIIEDAEFEHHTHSKSGDGSVHSRNYQFDAGSQASRLNGISDGGELKLRFSSVNRCLMKRLSFFRCFGAKQQHRRVRSDDAANGVDGGAGKHYVASAKQFITQGVGHSLRRSQHWNDDRPRSLRNSVQRQLARRRRCENSQRGLSGRRARDRGLQVGGGHLQEHSARESRVVHGRLHEAASIGHRDFDVQRKHALHAHPSAARQIQLEQDDADCTADSTRHELLASPRNRPQRLEVEEYLPGERESHHH